MNSCILKPIFILFCILIAFIGLYLATLREHKNIKDRNRDLQNGSGNIIEGSLSFKFAIGLVLILVGVLGGFFSIRDLPDCYSIAGNEKNNGNSKANNDSLDTTSTTALQRPDTARLDTTSTTAPLRPDTAQDKTVWEEDEDVSTGIKSSTRKINLSGSQEPVIIKIAGKIIFPILEDRSNDNQLKYDLRIKFFINGVTKDLWDEKFTNQGGQIFDIYKIITLERPSDDKVQLQMQFISISATKTYRDVFGIAKKGIIKKGFLIQIED